MLYNSYPQQENSTFFYINRITIQCSKFFLSLENNKSNEIYNKYLIGMKNSDILIWSFLAKSFFHETLLIFRQNNCIMINLQRNKTIPTYHTIHIYIKWFFRKFFIRRMLRKFLFFSSWILNSTWVGWKSKK